MKCILLIIIIINSDNGQQLKYLFSGKYQELIKIKSPTFSSEANTIIN